MTLEQFNQADAASASSIVRACLGVERWIAAIVGERPYSSLADLDEQVRSAAAAFTVDEIDTALSHHPRIGERVTGTHAEATMSRSEQAQVGITDATASAIRDGNRDYEEKFDRVFLIRASGRSANEILTVLRSRLQNSYEQESDIIESELRSIAMLRLHTALQGESEGQ